MYNVDQYIFHTHYFMITYSMIKYIPLILYITILWLYVEYNVIPYCGFFLWGWVSMTVLVGRWCCIGDTVVGVSFNFFHPPYFVISSCSGSVLCFSFSFAILFWNFSKAEMNMVIEDIALTWCILSFLLLTIWRRHDYCAVINFCLLFCGLLGI